MRANTSSSPLVRAALELCGIAPRAPAVFVDDKL